MVRRFIFLIVLGFLLSTAVHSQGTLRSIRIVDTLTAEEQSKRNPVLLKREVDSLLRAYSPVQQEVQAEPADLRRYVTTSLWLTGTVLFLVIVIGVMVYLLYRYQQKANRMALILQRQMRQLERELLSNFNGGSKVNGKANGSALEKKIHTLTRELEQLEAEKGELLKSITANTGIVHDFTAIKQKMMDVYKIRNYPGFDKGKTETEIVKSLLDTERSVALYAYEHFLKPVIAIADANKNNPAKINKEDRERMLNLLISLSLLYSEYLYLRINDLSVGGKIVERIGSLKNGNKIDPALLKQLNTEHGSRALVLRIALDKTAIQNLVYPVFDETNLNLS
jgi:hypothetical protein